MKIKWMWLEVSITFFSDLKIASIEFFLASNTVIQGHAHLKIKMSFFLSFLFNARAAPVGGETHFASLLPRTGSEAASGMMADKVETGECAVRISAAFDDASRVLIMFCGERRDRNDPRLHSQSWNIWPPSLREGNVFPPKQSWKLTHSLGDL